jgi:Ala-tRNA(Pro) deacylase
MPGAAIKKYLQDGKVRFTSTRHPAAFTAQEVAAAVHVSGHLLAKVVILKADGGFVMAVLPAPLRVDLERFRAVGGFKAAELAREQEFEPLFPGCERGAMPPFGGLYKLPVFVDEALAGRERLVFNAGTHTETIEMAYADFDRLTKPRVGSFARA